MQNYLIIQNTLFLSRCKLLQIVIGSSIDNYGFMQVHARLRISNIPVKKCAYA